MKKSEESKKTKQRHFIRMADKVVKYNFLGAGLTYLLTGSFSKAISFLLVDFSCALKNIHTCSLPYGHKGRSKSRNGY